MSSPGLTLPSPVLSEPGPILLKPGPVLSEPGLGLLESGPALSEPGPGLPCADRRMDGCTDSPIVLQDFVPFGSAALLTSKADS